MIDCRWTKYLCAIPRFAEVARVQIEFSCPIARAYFAARLGRGRVAMICSYCSAKWPQLAAARSGEAPNEPAKVSQYFCSPASWSRRSVCVSVCACPHVLLLLLLFALSKPSRGAETRKRFHEIIIIITTTALRAGQGESRKAGSVPSGRARM